MNKSAIATILATAAISIAKKASGSRSQGITVYSIDELIRHANDPKLAQMVIQVRLNRHNLDEIPHEIFKLSNLENLDLSYNQITSIPPEIGNLTALEDLWLGSNQITSIPPEIGNLTNLKNLWLFGNQITSIPPQIGNLNNLESIQLAGNQINSIPQEIGNLTNLEVLDLRYNPIPKIPPSQIREMIRKGYYKNPIIIQKLMKYLGTTPTSPIRRF